MAKKERENKEENLENINPEEHAAKADDEKRKKDSSGKWSKGEEAERLHREGAGEGDTDELVEEEELLKALAEQSGFEFRSLKDYTLENKELLDIVPGQLARRYKVFPLEIQEDGTLLIAISDPLNVHLLDDLQLFTNRPVDAVVASESDIKDLIEIHYRMSDESLDKIIDEMHTDKEVELDTSGEVNLSNLEEISSSPTIIKLVDLILLQAIKDRASDLHIEPFEEKTRVRYRVDGLLRELPPPPKHLHVGIISRIKVMANLDISETRKPQDGRIRLNVGGKEIDLRVATLPTVRGEGIAMRILDKSVMMMGLEQIGMDPDVLEDFDKIIHKPNGIILVTGPTGCGKTTTLYAAFSKINDPEDKLISTEDPVEYELSGVIQVNINPRVGLTFANSLRAILRQDPDKIMVGEVRDFETAQMAVQSSLTGHLVFSTLHTNSAAATLTRLIDMGVEPFLITSSLECVVGQRLVRTICPMCRESYEPTEEELMEFGKTAADVKDITFYHGMGCEDCAHTGYKGRIGVFELLSLDEELQDLVLEKVSTDELHQVALRKGMKSMREDGWDKVCAGITTFEEVIFHTPADEREEESTVEFESVVKKAEKKFKKPEKEYIQKGEEAIQATKSGDADRVDNGE